MQAGTTGQDITWFVTRPVHFACSGRSPAPGMTAATGPGATSQSDASPRATPFLPQGAVRS